MAKINLELGGKYSAGQIFKQAQNDVKQFGRETKDIGDIGVKAFGAIAAEVKGPMGTALGTAKNMLQGLATGGIFGVIAAAGQAAFSAIAGWIKDAKEKAKQLAETMSNNLVQSMKQVQANAQSLREEIRSDSKEMEDMLKVVNGKVSGDIKLRVADINLQTLQKMTDEMTDCEKKLVKAQGDYWATLEKANGAVRLAAWSQDEIRKRMKSLSDQRAEAESQLAEVQQQQSDYEKQYSRVVRDYTLYKELASQSVQDLIEQGKTEKQAVEELNRWNTRLAELKEKHGTVVENYDKIVEGVAAQEKFIADVDQEQVELKRKLRSEIKNEEVATQELALEKQKAQMAIDEAKKAVEAEGKRQADETEKKRRQQAEQEERDARKRANEIGYIEVIALCYQYKMDEARYTKLYNEFIRQGMSAAEAIINVQDVFKEHKENEAKITKVCAKYKENEAEYIKKYYEMIDKNLTEEQVFARLQRDLNEALKKRTDAENEAADQTKNGNTNDNKDKDKSNLTVSLNASATADIGNQVEEHMNFNDWQKKHREDLRKGRNAKFQMRQDLPAMTKALKGEMPKEQAEQWIKYAKAKYTPQQMTELANMARKTELMSTKSKEWHQQQERLRNMLKLMQTEDKDKKERDKNLKSTAENTKAMKDELKRANTIK